MANPHSLLGRTGQYTNANDISQRLIAVVADDLEKRINTPPTQSAIGKAIGVKQPFIHAVLYKGKSFAEKKFYDYAARRVMPIEDLVAKIQSIKLEDSWVSRISSVKASPVNTHAAVFDSYQHLHAKLRTERRITRSPDSDKAFDSYRAYSAVLSFMWDAFKLAGEEPLCVGVLTQEGTRSRAIWITDLLEGDREVTRQLDGDPLLQWILHQSETARIFSDDSSEPLSTVTVPTDLLPEEVAASSRLVEVAGSTVTLTVQNVYQDVPHDSSSTRARVSVVALSGDPIEHRLANGNMVLSCGAHLVEKIVSYVLEDNLRCAEMMLDTRLTFGDMLDNEGGPNALDVAEVYVQKLFDDILGSKQSHRIATCDVWVHYLSEREYVSPSSRFRRVNDTNAEVIVTDDGVSRTLRDAYEREFKRGRLEPRPLGKTRHMVAQRRAIVLNKRDNCLGSKAWSSSHVLEIGTFIGIPFIFHPLRDAGASFVSALYIRFTEDLLVEESREVIEDVVWAMRNKKYQGRFVPLMRLKKVSKTKRPRFAWHQFKDRRGVWYEVGNENEIADLEESSQASAENSSSTRVLCY